MASLQVVSLPNTEVLSEFVHNALCEHDRLDPEQTPLFRTTLKRAGQPCGILFHVEGPRGLKNSAVWAEDEHRIIFYDCMGVRFREVRLSESPEVKAA
jgi:hypothetical protein